MEAGQALNAKVFFLLVLALMCFGFLMVFSATSVDVRGHFGDTHFVVRQLIWGAVALAALAGAMLVPQKWLRRGAPALFAASVVLLALVLVLGTELNHAKRWFRFGPVGVQPSEIAKVAMILYLAWLLAGPATGKRRRLRTFLHAAAAIGVVSALILVEPDFGCAFFVAGWAFLVLLVGGIRWYYLAGSAALGLPAAVWLVMSSPRHMSRIMIFRNPWADPQGAGHQLIQSLIALGSGGVRGAGLGLGQQRLSFLPEASTDFIFAVIGEQLGVVGTGAVLVLFGLLLFFGARIIAAARNRFLYLVGFGALSMLVAQAAANIAVVTGSIPTKGIALPFLSFGGSGLVWAGTAAGLILNMARSAAPAPAVSRARSIAGETAPA